MSATSPWKSMWTRPRETIRTVVKSNPNNQLWRLAAVYGFPMLLNMSQSMSLGASVPLIVILVVSALLAAPIGMLGFTITSALVQWTGRWLGGAGSFPQIRAAVAWSNVTNLGTSLLWLLLVLFMGSTVFLKTFPQTNVAGGTFALVGLIFFAQTILSVWSFILLLCALAEVQKFSIWRAIVNVILPFVIVTIALWILFVFIGWAVGMKS